MNSTITLRHIVVGAAAVALAAGLGACGKQEDKAKSGSSLERVVKIGHAAPLTGGIAHLGKDNEYGAKLAIDEANAKGTTIGGEKIVFELVSEDDEAKPDKGPIIAQKFVDAKVAGVVIRHRHHVKARVL